jgi:hypothetical protein
MLTSELPAVRTFGGADSRRRAARPSFAPDHGQGVQRCVVRCGPGVHMPLVVEIRACPSRSLTTGRSAPPASNEDVCAPLRLRREDDFPRREAPVRAPGPPFIDQTARLKVQAPKTRGTRATRRRCRRHAHVTSPGAIEPSSCPEATRSSRSCVAKRERERHYALRKSLWAFTDDRVAVRFQYE